MTYMLLIYSPQQDADPTQAEFEGMLTAYAAFTEQVRNAGAFVDASPLSPPSSATTVRVRGGQSMITDGPFAETKEWLAGYYVLECESLDKALEFAAACPGSSYGSVEIRPVMDLPG